MRTLTKKPVAKKRNDAAKGIAREEISARLVDLDIAHTSALRDLEMDIAGEIGTDSSTVLKNARLALAR